MALAPGARFGPYEISAQIGAGGMGEVYRAKDSNLERDVAIKVLPDLFAQDPERLARFEREAKTLASLNHPNIAIVYGLEKASVAKDSGQSAVRALIMELVDGPTLADRIAQGPIPVDEALPIAKQIADALEAAHEQGIIHRDLKPANVKVRPDGTVKVLDFGLAKALEPPGAMSPGLTQSPTITSPAMMTGVGVLLGTAAYMSPEQARGKAVDKRTDIWAFGAVLYEMLTGRRAFVGDEVSDVLASVLAREPDWTMLPAGLSSVLVTYIKRCLYKDRRQRIRDIGDVSLALEGAFDPASHVAQALPVALPVWRRAVPIAMTAATAVLITGLAAWSLWPSVEPRSAARFDYELPEGQQLQYTTQRPIVATSLDGRHFVYQTNGGLYLRSMADLEARLIPGTAENLNSPFLSPDGQWVGYWAGTGELKKMAVSGGAPVILCRATIPSGVSWALDNTILFGQNAGVMRVSANGGTPELIIRAGEGEQLYGPQLLPDGGSVLFSVTTDNGPARWDQAQVVVQSLSSGKRTPVVQGGSDARYLSTGHLIYALRDGLTGVAFDEKRLTVTGGAVPLVQGVQRPVGVNAAGSNYAVSDQGTLVYVSTSSAVRSLVWMNRNGTAALPVGSIPPGTYEDPRVSPDGGRILVTRDGDIWIYEVASGRSSRLTRDGSSLMGVWDPTGSQVAYSSARGGNLEAWVAPSDGAGEPRQLTKLGGQVHVDSWSPDGRTLAVHHHPPERPVNIFMLPMDRADPKPELFLERDFNAEGADFSRDGRYVAYLSVETGEREVYIRPYPGPGGQVTVSVGGGREPVWAENGDLFYRSLNGERMFAVSVTTAPTLKVGTPVQVFQGPYYISRTGSPRPQYDVMADGQRFLLLAPSPGRDSSAGRPRMVVVQNWQEELKRRLPTN
jgi:eukaryotic-like serine/threonine-protein kinase